MDFVHTVTDAHNRRTIHITVNYTILTFHLLSCNTLLVSTRMWLSFESEWPTWTSGMQLWVAQIRFEWPILNVILEIPSVIRFVL